MKNIMFDLGATIITDKSFDQLSVEELCQAVEKRLVAIRSNDGKEAFGFCDEHEQEPPTYTDRLVMAVVTNLEHDIDTDEMDPVDEMLTKIAQMPEGMKILEAYLPDDKLTEIQEYKP
jgi:hypothetical protein